MFKLTEKEELARKRVCLPLDGLPTMDDALQRVKELKEIVGMFKIGKELFTRFGPDLIELVKNHEVEIFLDLKYHDIPNTIMGAADAATQLGVYMFNVHASGGLEMMEAAKDGAEQASRKYGVICPKVLAVTILTSIDQNIMNEELGIFGTVEEQVLRLAKLTKKAGLDGIVCSAADLSFIKKELPDNFMFVTPGIKGPKTKAGADQKRVATPGNAIQDGSTILVIGRAITGQSTKKARLQAGYEVLQDMVKYI